MPEQGEVGEYRVREFRICPERGQAFRGQTLLPLKAKGVAVLVALIERRGRVVSKEELMDLAWPGLFIEEGNVKHQISMIRQVLGPSFVETVGRVGYQFGERLEPSSQSPIETNLPSRTRALIGRDDDIDLLEQALEKRRLVTIMGTGGVGKTSLAEAIGHRIMARREGSVWLLEVSGLPDADAIAAGIARLIDRDSGRPAAGTAELARAIGAQRPLVILDGCEHALSAVTGFASAMLAACSGLRILATSRIALGSGEEHRFLLEPLAFEGRAATASEALSIPAVRLLLEKAEAADLRFRLDDRDVPKTLELCRLLDGLPLALEIVGARLPVLGLDALSGRLAEFCLEGADPLANALAFSWSMLGPRERLVLPRLATLGGSFDAVLAGAAVGPELSRAALLGAIGGLVDHSLLVVERGRKPRYRLFDTTRAYALARLDAPEREASLRRSASSFAERLEAVEAGWRAGSERDWCDTLLPDLDCLRGVLGWATSESGDRDLAMKLAGRSSQLWGSIGLPGEGRKWLESAIDRGKGAAVDPLVEATVWRGLGALAQRDDIRLSSMAYRRSAQLYRTAGSRDGEGGALLGLGMAETYAGNLDEAERILDRARKRLERSNALNWFAGCLETLSFVYFKTDRPELSRQMLDEALDVVRRVGDQVHLAQIESNLAELAFFQGDIGDAVARAEAATERLRETRGARNLVISLFNLAIYLEAAGDQPGAAAIAAEALPQAAVRGGDTLVLLVELVVLIYAEARSVVAAKLLGWADAMKARGGRARQPAELVNYGRARSRLAAALPAIRLRDAMAEGALWSEGQAADTAAALLQDGGPARRATEPLAEIRGAKEKAAAN
jgi:predicted ATPase/DNA-binding winged helix-turn-helix (wHTH) protein